MRKNHKYDFTNAKKMTSSILQMRKNGKFDLTNVKK